MLGFMLLLLERKRARKKLQIGAGSGEKDYQRGETRENALGLRPKNIQPNAVLDGGLQDYTAHLRFLLVTCLHPLSLYTGALTPVLWADSL